MKKEFRFDFGVYSLTEAQAEKLFDKIVELVEALDANLGGGYREYEAEEATQDES